VFIVLVFAVTLSRFRGNHTCPERAVRSFSNRIEQGNFNGLTLTIFYRDTRSTFHFPQSVEDYVGHGMYEYRIIVDGNELEAHKHLLNKISADNLSPVTQAFPIMVKLYYEFAINGRRIFGVVPLHYFDDSRMLINGVEFDWDDSFFDIIKPFLPENSPWLRA